jgi:hypothetical protein
MNRIHLGSKEDLDVAITTNELFVTTCELNTHQSEISIVVTGEKSSRDWLEQAITEMINALALAGGGSVNSGL